PETAAAQINGFSRHMRLFCEEIEKMTTRNACGPLHLQVSPCTSQVTTNGSAVTITNPSVINFP
ncbi:hypothetical protein, partial [Delftia acidovorans]|uniref:hypothetical protein n=1 Tax=Delftia acidovorans TaxID=80866 RepID=UPI0035A003CD